MKEKRYYKLSKELNEQIVREYQENSYNSSRVLAKKYKVSNVRILNILKEYKIPIGKRQGYYDLDIDYFKTINTNNKAYFLGLFHSDGCNSETMGTIKLSLQEEDKKILELLKKDIKFTGPLRFVKREGNRKIQCAFSITCKEMSSDLIKLGYPSNKTYKVKYPNISEEFHSHFIRGVFDGDGCIFIQGNRAVFQIVGTYDTLINIQNILNIKANVEVSNIVESKTKGIFRYIINASNDIYKAMTFLYTECKDMFMDRKYEKYKEHFLDKQSHLYWKVYCKNIETKEEIIFNNYQEGKLFFNLKAYGCLSYCILKSKNKIYRNKYYMNLLQNENLTLEEISKIKIYECSKSKTA